METGRRTLDPRPVRGLPDMAHPQTQKPVKSPVRASQPHSPPGGGARVPQAGGLAAISTPTRGSLETPLGGIRGNRTYPHSWKQDVPPIRGNRVHPHSWK